MKQRFTVRKHPENKYLWCVWDRVENRVTGHPRWHKPDLQNQCFHFNKAEKKREEAVSL